MTLTELGPAASSSPHWKVILLYLKLLLVVAMMHQTREKLWNTADIRNACLLPCPTVSCMSL